MALTFCGASVRGFSSNIGWNEQQSTFRCSVVEDLDNEDFFNPPPVGTPVYFQYGAFKFFGLLQKWVRSNSTDGLPVFDIDCVDPRQILEGSQVITGAYRGAVTVNNIFNVFGWWENLTGFGSSLSNDTGMPYYKVAEALSVMTNSLTGNYGTAMSYRGIRYSLDLSELPIPPAYYRVPSPAISLLELITMVCEDGGCDYFVELDIFTIRIRTVSRTLAAPIGVIGSLQGTGYGIDLLQSGAGLESRNETTSAFVVGAERKDLYMTSIENIKPFWGFDIDGNPIMGTGAGIAHTFNLNASEVADIVGGVSYNCTVYELCCAMAGQESWMAYIEAFKPALVTQMKLPVGLGNIFNNPIFANDKVKQDAQAMNFANQAIIENINHVNAQRMFQFIQTYATDYMGKKFLVAIPFTLTAVEPETLKTIYSQEPTDGGYLIEGTSPLGIPPLVEDQFKTQDGRFEAFCLFNNLATVDTTRLTGQDGGMYIGEAGIYLKVAVDDKVVFTPAPAVIVTINNPIYEITQDALGDLTLVAQILGNLPADVEKMAENLAGGNLMGLKVHPPAHQPDFIAIALKSNVLTYGPWSLQGAPGKVRFEIDSSLAPWNFGGYELMNLAGEAKVTQAISDMQVVETGNLNFAGPPRWALGDLLQGNGPNITSIDVSYGDRGITTVYRMTTFTPKLGTGNFNKDAAKRVERLGRIAAEMRKNLRASINRGKDAQMVYTRAAQGQWLHNIAARLKQESPHTTFVGIIKDDPNLAGTTRTSIATGTLGEIVTGCGGHDDEIWKRSSVMSLTGLLRPFSTNPSASGISHYTSPSGTFPANVMSSVTYNPFADGQDMNELAFGTTYQRLNPQYDYDNNHEKRPMGLRGPLVVTGWGQTVDGMFVPGTGSGTPSSSYVSGYMRKSHLWKTGPVDLRWDDKRGVWTAHDLLSGIMKTTINGGATGYVEVSNGASYAGYDILVNNWFTGNVGSGVKVICGYCVNANTWHIIAADCTV